VDILVERGEENLHRLLFSLSTYGEGFAKELTLADFPDEEGAVRIVEETEQSQLDIFTMMSGLHLRGPGLGCGTIDAAALRKLAEDPRSFD